MAQWLTKGLGTLEGVLGGDTAVGDAADAGSAVPHGDSSEEVKRLRRMLEEYKAANSALIQSVKELEVEAHEHAGKREIGAHFFVRVCT